MGLTENWIRRTELTYAILRRDTLRALELLEQGAAPCHVDYTSCSDLYFAAQESEPEVLRDLLRQGADPDGRPGRFIPLLGAMYSVQVYMHQTEFDAYGRAFEMVKALLEAGRTRTSRKAAGLPPVRTPSISHPAPLLTI